jgi:hypothetical protein
MKYFAALLVLSTSLLAVARAQPPELIHYQGRLLDGTNLVHGPASIRFEIHDHPVNNTLLFAATNRVMVNDGLYTALIGEHVVTGSMDVALSGPEAWLQVIVNDQPLTPRERLVAVPYARQVHGLAVGDEASVVLVPEEGNAVTNQGERYGVVSGGRNNTIGGEAGVIGGGEANAIANISGWSTIGGGRENTLDDFVIFSVIGGGYSNRVANTTANATIGGGFQNRIASNADNATIPGGVSNAVNRPFGFAAGRRATANHNGAFVWNASANGLTSTASNQFLIGASGGVGINTNNPQAALHVAGDAMIGNNPQPAKFGMQRINASASGVLFTHPATQVTMSWIASNRTLIVSNATPNFIQASISLMRSDSPDVAFSVMDVPVASTVSLASVVNAEAGSWTVHVGSDNRPEGFTFQGTGFGAFISGLVTYWE